jgi:predicted transcriptional regulator
MATCYRHPAAGDHVADKRTASNHLGRRERQIMDAVFELGEASVADVRANLPDPPSYSAVRTMIRHLESKRLLRHRRDGNRYVYRPTQSPETARRSALRHLLKTFFQGSPTDAVAAILDVTGEKLTDADLARIESLIDQARQKGE